MEKESLHTSKVGPTRLILIISAISALLSELFFRPNYSAEFTVFKGFGIFSVPEIIPVSVIDWFDLFHNLPLVGLVLLDGADLVHYILVGVIFLGLFITMQKKNPWINRLALVLGLAGIVIFLVSNKAFAFYQLSQDYLLADAIQRTDLITRAEIILALYDPLAFSWINTGKSLILLSGLLFSISMLRWGSFPKITGVMGTISNGVGLLYVPMILWLPQYFLLPTPISAPFRLVWHLLIAGGFFKKLRRDYNE